MTLFFENNTTIYPNDAENRIIMANSGEVGVRAQLIHNRYSEYLNRRPDLDFGDSAKSKFDLERADLMLSLSDKDAEKLYNFKHCRNVVSTVIFLILFVLIIIIVRLVIGYEETGYDEFLPEIPAFMAAAVVSMAIGNFVAKKKYGDKLPARFSENHFNYKFYDKYIVMKSDFDGKVIRYDEIRLFEDDFYCYIMCGVEKYVLDKSGFSVPYDAFKNLMADKGIEIVPYFGQP